MAADIETPLEVEPVLLERGRYALTQMPAGHLVVTMAAPICERCQSCGCGEPQEPIDTSAAGLMAFASRLGIGGGVVKNMMKMMPKMGNGNGH